MCSCNSCQKSANFLGVVAAARARIAALSPATGDNDQLAKPEILERHHTIQDVRSPNLAARVNASSSAPQSHFGLLGFDIAEIPHYLFQSYTTSLSAVRHLDVSIDPPQEWLSKLVFEKEIGGETDVMQASQKYWWDSTLYRASIEHRIKLWNRLLGSGAFRHLDESAFDNLVNQMERMIQAASTEQCRAELELLQFREEYFVVMFGIRGYKSAIDGREIS